MPHVLLSPFVTTVWTPMVFAIINIILAKLKMFMMMMMMMNSNCTGLRKNTRDLPPPEVVVLNYATGSAE